METYQYKCVPCWAQRQGKEIQSSNFCVKHCSAGLSLHSLHASKLSRQAYFLGGGGGGEQYRKEPLYWKLSVLGLGMRNLYYFSLNFIDDIEAK